METLLKVQKEKLKERKRERERKKEREWDEKERDAIAKVQRGRITRKRDKHWGGWNSICELFNFHWIFISRLQTRYYRSVNRCHLH